MSTTNSWLDRSLNHHSASKNGHPIPTVNGIGFEDGHPVGVQQFDYDAADRVFINEQREIGRREALMDQFKTVEDLQVISQDENPKLAIDCYNFAAQLTDLSEVQIAKRHGVHKAAVSKRVKQWQRRRALPPSAAMRSDKACETFKEATTKSWKKKKQNQKTIKVQKSPRLMEMLLRKPGLAT